MAINFIKDLLGFDTAQGAIDKMAGVPQGTKAPALEAIVISEAEAEVLAKVGVPATPQGLIAYVEGTVDAAIAGDDNLSDTEKSVLTDLVNSLGKVIPAAG